MAPLQGVTCMVSLSDCMHFVTALYHFVVLLQGVTVWCHCMVPRHGVTAWGVTVSLQEILRRCQPSYGCITYGSQSVPLLAILASSLTLTCLSLIKSTLYQNLVIFISETSVESVIFFHSLQPQLLQTHLSPANLTIAIHFTLASHKQISTNFNAFKIHWHVSLQTLQNINTSHQHSKNYTDFPSNKESITKSVFSHTKHLQINNLHIFTIVFHLRHILFLHDLLIHLFFPFHMSDHHLAKGLSLSSVHDSGIHSLLTPETRLLYQYSVPDSKHTSSKLRSLPRLFPISLDCLPGF